MRQSRTVRFDVPREQDGLPSVLLALEELYLSAISLLLTLLKNDATKPFMVTELPGRHLTSNISCQDFTDSTHNEQRQKIFFICSIEYDTRVIFQKGNRTYLLNFISFLRLESLSSSLCNLPRFYCCILISVILQILEKLIYTYILDVHMYLQQFMSMSVHNRYWVTLFVYFFCE